MSKLRLLSPIALCLIVACGGPSESAAPLPEAPSLDASRIASATGTSYVLAYSAEWKKSPFSTIDITCDANRTANEIHDTLTLFSDGRVRRNTLLNEIRRIDGVHEETPHTLVENGTWTTYKTTHYGYYDEGPGIILTMGDPAKQTYRWYLRAMPSGGFSTRAARGGSCAPNRATVVADPPRDDEWFFLPR